MKQVEIRITDLAHDGRGLGFLSQSGQDRGLAVFVEHALPGQTILCRITKRAANFCQAVLIEVLASDFASVSPHCPQQAVCGGCHLQPLPYARQLFWKEKLALDALLRIGRLDKEELDAAWTGLAPSPLLQSFRNKITLAFGKTAAGKPALGLRAVASHAVIPIAACALLHKSAFPIIQKVSELALASDLPVYAQTGFWRFLTLRRACAFGDNKPGWHALLLTSTANRAQRKLVEKLGQELLATQPDLRTFIHAERRRNDMLAIGEKRLLCLDKSGKNESGVLTLELGGKQFGLDAASFFQVNSAASEILAARIQELDKAGEGRLLDLFCGVGAPGLLLVQKHTGCLGIEQDEAACRWAARNAAGLPGFNYECGNVGAKLQGMVQAGRARKFHTVLLDPPRSGLGEAGMRDALALAPRQIIHISCNPATLARDARVLRASYRLERLAGVDMFPHTPHLECCGLWIRR